MLELKGLKKGFDLPNGERKEVFEIESISFPKTGLFAICGPSGEGKTTLLNLLALLDHPSEGEILFNGRDISKLWGRIADSYRLSHIGYLRQDADLLPYLNAFDNATLPLRLSKKVSWKEGIERAKSLFEKFGLSSLTHSFPATLSGGERSRVALARSLILSPDILLVDEPTGALGKEDAIRVMGLLKEASRERLVICVSHDEELVNSFADSLLRLENGKLGGEMPKKEGESEPSFQKPCKKPFPSPFLLWKRTLRKPFLGLLVVLIGAIGVIGTSVCYSIRERIESAGESLSRDARNAMPLSVSSFYFPTISGFVSLDTGELLPNESYVYPSESRDASFHANLLDNDFLSYLENELGQENYSPRYDAVCGILVPGEGGKLKVASAGSGEIGGLDLSLLSIFFGDTPILKPSYVPTSTIAASYDLLYGETPNEEKGDLFLIIDQDNSVPKRVLDLLGLQGERVSFSDIKGKSIKFIPNESLYKRRAITKSVSGRFLKDSKTLEKEHKSIPTLIGTFLYATQAYQEGDLETAKAQMSEVESYFGEMETRTLYAYSPYASSALKEVYNNEEIGETLQITSIYRRKSTSYLHTLQPGLYYGKGISERMRLLNAESKVAMEAHSHLVLQDGSTTLRIPETYSTLDKVEKTSSEDISSAFEGLLNYYKERVSLGAGDAPSSIEFPYDDANSATKARNVLEAYNKDRPDEKKIRYSDYGEEIANIAASYSALLSDSATFIFVLVLTCNLLISLLFFAFQARGRRREIAIYRYLGAGKGGIISLFAAEGAYLGLFSGALGITATYITLRNFNAMVFGRSVFFAVEGIATLSFANALLMVGINLGIGILSSLVVAFFMASQPIASSIKEE